MLPALATAPAHAVTPQETMRPDAATTAAPSLPGIFGAPTPRAVLAVNHDSGRYILDNLSAKPTEHWAVSGYRPVYSVNTRGQWLALQVKPATTRVASLEPVVPSPEPIADEAAKAPVADAAQGLKLPEAAPLASG